MPAAGRKSTGNNFQADGVGGGGLGLTMGPSVFFSKLLEKTRPVCIISP
jgi:hypothetical protein